MAQRRKLPPIHPGSLLRDELEEIGVSLNELARALRVPMNRISAIVNGRRAITVDTAMRLARYFGNSPQFWLNLQNAYDLEVAGVEMQPRIAREVLPRNAA
ncbi:MAG: HigA family addiction module antidote protein [Acidobacteria bacterium]|nr:HigA family addiction module antidote protein [Acidobacteriota bacterium]